MNSLQKAELTCFLIIVSSGTYMCLGAIKSFIDGSIIELVFCVGMLVYGICWAVWISKRDFYPLSMLRESFIKEKGAQ